MKSNEGRNPQNRIKNCGTGTIHWANGNDPACGPIGTLRALLQPSVATVTCERCIARWGQDVPGHIDPPRIQDHVARREAERAARRNAREEV